jgi:hypothetical protein
MDYEKLKKSLGDRKLHASILGNYRGPYSLGIVMNGETATLRLRVEAEASPKNFPHHVNVHGEKVPLTVVSDFKRPTAGPLKIIACSSFLM